MAASAVARGLIDLPRLLCSSSDEEYQRAALDGRLWCSAFDACIANPLTGMVQWMFRKTPLKAGWKVCFLMASSDRLMYYNALSMP
jgi:hypothetical protein